MTSTTTITIIFIFYCQLSFADQIIIRVKVPPIYIGYEQFLL